MPELTGFARALQAVNSLSSMLDAISDDRLAETISRLTSVVALLEYPHVHLRSKIANFLRKVHERDPDSLRALDASMLRRVLESARREEAEHPRERDYEELVENLAILVGEQPTDVRTARVEGPGQVLLQMGVRQSLEPAREALLQKLAPLDGVLSINIEAQGSYILVATRSLLEVDSNFLAQLLDVVHGEGFECANVFGVGELATDFTVRTDITEGFECPICLESRQRQDDTDEFAVMTVCRHVFHHHCLRHWMQSRDSCPVCRVRLQAPYQAHAPHQQMPFEAVEAD